jgi:multidrug/hemolysin transport system permease protein
MLIKRNLLLFFRDKGNVFFSLLAVLIILGLYVLFLGSMMEANLREALGFDSDKIGVVMAGLTLAGMVAAASVTSCLGALNISVADKTNAAKDFFTSPVSRGKLTLSYVLGSAVVGIIMTLTALLLSELYIIANGGASPGPADCARLLLTAFLSVLCGNAMVFFIIIFVKSQSAFTALSTVIGTLIGFLIGVYIPIGQLPTGVQWLIKCFPMTHAASMFRQILADGELATLFANAPAETLTGFRETFGVTLAFGGFTSNFWFSALILATTTVIFYTLSATVIRVRH